MAAVFRIVEVDPDLLKSERDRILALLRVLLPSLDPQEVGSTAVEGCIGKQDVDFAVAVPAEQFSQVREVLDAHFTRDAGQFSSAEYQAYKVPSELDVAVQLFIRGGQFDRFHDFVAALKADGSLLASYNALKREWDGRPMDAYRNAKAHFIERVLSART